MKTLLFISLSLVSLFAQAHTCPSVFIDYGLLARWDLSKPQAEKLAAIGEVEFLQQTTKTIHLLESAPRNFFRLMSLIFPLGRRGTLTEPMQINPVLRDQKLANGLWEQAGLPEVAEWIQHIEPQWYQAHLKDLSAQAMDLTASSALFTLPSIDHLDPMKGPELVQIQSLGQLYRPDELTMPYLDLLASSHFSRLELVRFMFNSVTGQWPSSEESETLLKALECQLAGTEYEEAAEIKLAASICANIMRSFAQEPMVLTAGNLVSLITRIHGLLIQSSDETFQGRLGLHQVAKIRSYLEQDTLGSKQHWLIFLSGLLSTQIPVRWLGPEEVQQKISEGLRIQLQVLSRARF